MHLYLFILLLACFTPYGQPTAATPHHHRYIILGAGPGGLQLAHYLQSASRDYLVLDSKDTPGSFFQTYPRFRQLISINKASVGRNDSLPFAQRHDWNSLLSDPSHAAGGLPSTTDARLTPSSEPSKLRFSGWSTEYYPQADTLHQYLGAWANWANENSSSATPWMGRSHPLRVRYNTTITRVSAYSGDRRDARFTLTAGASNGGVSFSCQYLIIATGLQEPVPFPGKNFSSAQSAGLVHTYSTAPTDLEAYRAKRVLILGHGNAAFEFAHHTLGVAAYVHVAGRSNSRLKLALESHYPGHVRAVHGTLLETYNLKSLDGITSAVFDRLTFSRASEGEGVTVALSPTTCTHDAFGRPTSRCSFRKPYDMVVACLGWRFSLDMFDQGVRPTLASNKKHPDITPRYESRAVPGMFFAGTLAHALDHKKASGGFIHGFRYTARALHRILEEEEKKRVAAQAAMGGSLKEEEEKEVALTTSPSAIGGVSLAPPAYASWPSTPVTSLRALVALILRRVNSGAGCFQMFGHLVDVFVLGPLAHSQVKHFVTEGPLAAMHEPWSFYDHGAARAAREGTDPTGLAQDVAQSQRTRPHSSPPPGHPPLSTPSPSERASEEAMDAALTGGLREEVPVGMVGEAAQAWGGEQQGGGTTPTAAVEWLTIALEFGPSPPPGAKDPFALDRALSSLSHPETSRFLHPVIRYFSTYSPSSPLATLHLIEDFHAEFDLHTAHVLPLARFLQHLGALRARGYGGGGGEASLQYSITAWPPPTPPPPFLGNIITQLLTGCEGGGATLFWGGAAFPSGGESDGWWLKMSMAAQASLRGLRGIAVHSANLAPLLPLSPGEEEYTKSVRERWAYNRGKDKEGGEDLGGEGEGGQGEELFEAPRPEGIPLTDLPASTHHYRALTQATKGLGVLLLDGRAGRCRVLAENLGVKLGGVKVFYPKGKEEVKGEAISVDVEGQLSAQLAVPHIKGAFKLIK